MRMNEANPKLTTDDDMLPDYGADFFKRGVRGKYRAAYQKGASVTIHHANGSVTRKVISPAADVTITAEHESKNVAGVDPA